MPALVFNKCCGCIELKTGCFIIGYLNLVGLIIANILGIVALIGGSVMASNGKDQETKEIGAAAVVIMGIVLVFLVLALAFAIVLLVGLHKNKPGHLKAYLIYSVIFMVVTVIQFIATVCTQAVAASSIVQNLASIIIGIYFILVIRSMYYEMKDTSKGPAIYTSA